MNKAKVQFVSAADYHARDKTLATREDIAETNRRIDNVRDSLRADIRAIHNVIIGGFITLFVALVTLVGGIGAVIVKLFFGG